MKWIDTKAQIFFALTLLAFVAWSHPAEAEQPEELTCDSPTLVGDTIAFLDLQAGEYVVSDDGAWLAEFCPGDARLHLALTRYFFRRQFPANLVRRHAEMMLTATDQPEDAIAELGDLFFEVRHPAVAEVFQAAERRYGVRTGEWAGPMARLYYRNNHFRDASEHLSVYLSRPVRRVRVDQFYGVMNAVYDYYSKQVGKMRANELSAKETALLDHVERSIRRNRKFSDVNHFELALVQAKRGDWSRALSYLRIGRDEQPRSLFLNYAVIEMAHVCGALPNELAFLQNAIKADPEWLGGYILLMDAMRRLRDFEGAWQVIQAAKSAIPQSFPPVVEVELAIQLGRWDRVEALIEQPCEASRWSYRCLTPSAKAQAKALAMLGKGEYRELWLALVGDPLFGEAPEVERLQYEAIALLASGEVDILRTWRDHELNKQRRGDFRSIPSAPCKRIYSGNFQDSLQAAYWEARQMGRAEHLSRQVFEMARRMGRTDEVYSDTRHRNGLASLGLSGQLYKSYIDTIEGRHERSERRLSRILDQAPHNADFRMWQQLRRLFQPGGEAVTNFESLYESLESAPRGRELFADAFAIAPAPASPALIDTLGFQLLRFPMRTQTAFIYQEISQQAQQRVDADQWYFDYRARINADSDGIGVDLQWFRILEFARRSYEAGQRSHARAALGILVSELNKKELKKSELENRIDYRKFKVSTALDIALEHNDMLAAAYLPAIMRLNTTEEEWCLLTTFYAEGLRLAGEPQAALDVLARYEVRRGNWGLAHYTGALAGMDAGEWDTARAFINEALAKDPDDPVYMEVRNAINRQEREQTPVNPQFKLSYVLENDPDSPFPRQYRRLYVGDGRSAMCNTCHVAASTEKLPTIGGQMTEQPLPLFNDRKTPVLLP